MAETFILSAAEDLQIAIARKKQTGPAAAGCRHGKFAPVVIRIQLSGEVSWRRWLAQAVRAAWARVLAMAGNRSAASVAMMAITTSNSIIENPEVRAAGVVRCDGGSRGASGFPRSWTAQAIKFSRGSVGGS